MNMVLIQVFVRDFGWYEFTIFAFAIKLGYSIKKKAFLNSVSNTQSEIEYHIRG